MVAGIHRLGIRADTAAATLMVAIMLMIFVYVFWLRKQWPRLRNGSGGFANGIYIAHGSPTNQEAIRNLLSRHLSEEADVKGEATSAGTSTS